MPSPPLVQKSEAFIRCQYCGDVYLRPLDTDRPWYCPDCERAMEADQPTKEDR